ncbi:MAG: hypothetical protein K5866_05550 [Treponema sp.]|nr:hypothetical protein [Treponema sp.]
MGNLKKIISVMIFLLAASFIFARQLCIQVVQHDFASESVTEQSLAIEDELLNVFFEKGFIVTNSPTVVFENEEKSESIFKQGLSDAFFGYSDYFIQVNVFYENRANSTAEIANIEKIDWSLTEAKTGVRIYNNTLKGFNPINKKNDMQKVTSSLTNEIDKALSSNKA